jgi:hypothetical protein
MRRKIATLGLSVAVISSLFITGVGADPGGPDEEKRGLDGIVNRRSEVYGEEGGDPGPQQHDGLQNHLPPTQKNVNLVGKLKVTDIPNKVSDLTWIEGHAILGEWTGGLVPPDCRGGVWIVDATTPSNPKLVAQQDLHAETYATEGVQALQNVDTPFFQGDLLVISNEACGERGIGGLTLLDITEKDNPRLLSEGFGDFTIGETGDPDAIVEPVAHESHSAFAWKDDGHVYVTMIDNEETLDVDFMDITDPRNPVFLSETGLEEWPNVEIDAHGDFPTAHDFDVREVEGEFYEMVSYWDAGWVLLEVENPANPQFITDSNYPDCSPIPTACPPEGNAHQGEWNLGRGLFLGTDEDQNSYRTEHEILTGPYAGEWPAGEFSWTVPIVTLPDKSLNGPTVFGGYGCPDDVDEVPDASILDPFIDEENEDRIVVFQRGPVSDPNHAHDACLFSEKVETGQNKGYDGVVIANHHVGSQAGAQPDAFFCGGQGHEFEITVSATCIGHREMHLLFDMPEDPDQTYPPDYTVPYPLGDPGDVEPDPGDLGYDVAFTAIFDSWGGVRLLDADSPNLKQIDETNIPVALDEDFAIGFGDLSVHEVAVDKWKKFKNLAYFAWYSGGFRVAHFDHDGIKLVGRFIPAGGHDLWGVQLAGKFQDNDRLIAVSDLDFGLFLYDYTGNED